MINLTYTKEQDVEKSINIVEFDTQFELATEPAIPEIIQYWIFNITSVPVNVDSTFVYNNNLATGEIELNDYTGITIANYITYLTSKDFSDAYYDCISVPGQPTQVKFIGVGIYNNSAESINIEGITMSLVEYQEGQSPSDSYDYIKDIVIDTFDRSLIKDKVYTITVDLQAYTEFTDSEDFTFPSLMNVSCSNKFYYASKLPFRDTIGYPIYMQNYNRQEAMIDIPGEPQVTFNEYVGDGAQYYNYFEFQAGSWIITPRLNQNGISISYISRVDDPFAGIDNNYKVKVKITIDTDYE